LLSDEQEFSFSVYLSKVYLVLPISSEKWEKWVNKESERKRNNERKRRVGF
jgi:hypothetical protein